MNLPVNMFAEYQATYIHDKRYVVTKNWNFRVLKYFLKDFKCISVLSACMLVYHVCAQCPMRPEEGIESPGTEV